MTTGVKVNNGSDLETGRLSVPGNNYMGIMPDVSWSTTSHIGVDIPFYVE
ncbi:MAG: hypothetical protein PF693_09800 [Spirochaetia bacterium]|jgi:hypothetical protein|nr:hypothetical protein [Spirochaetia bacterium]